MVYLESGILYLTVSDTMDSAISTRPRDISNDSRSGRPPTKKIKTITGFFI